MNPPDFSFFLIALTEKNHNLKQEIDQLRSQLTETQNQLKYAKSQNADLMNSLQSYKEEASKWHYLYHSRKKSDFQAKTPCDFSNIHYNNIE